MYHISLNKLYFSRPNDSEQEVITISGSDVIISGTRIPLQRLLTDGQWHFIVLVFYNNEMQLLIDGKSVKQLNSNPLSSKGEQSFVNNMNIYIYIYLYIYIYIYQYWNK